MGDRGEATNQETARWRGKRPLVSQSLFLCRPSGIACEVLLSIKRTPLSELRLLRLMRPAGPIHRISELFMWTVLHLKSSYNEWQRMIIREK